MPYKIEKAQESFRALKIFIAYARKDASFLKELRLHMRPLERTGRVKIWYDGMIEPGMVWEAVIKENLYSADIILLFISADALDSDFFYTKEIPLVIERHRKGEVIVIPLILRPCAWMTTPLAELQALPKDGKPITTWIDKDSAYANVIDNLLTLMASHQFLEKKQGGQEHRDASKGREQKHTSPAVYFKTLSIQNVRCFKGRNTIDLSDGKGRPAQWTVILGNNNTGKTTLLRCLAGLEATTETISNGAFSPKAYRPKSIPMWEKRGFGVGSELYISQLNLSQLNEGHYQVATFQWQFFYLNSILVDEPFLSEFQIETYGASRKMSSTPFAIDAENRHESLFENADLANVEEWLLQLHFAKLQGNEQAKEKADKIIGKANEILTSGLLPDVKAVWFKSEDKGQSFDNFLEFETDFGEIRLRDLGYGYQTMLAWVLDLVRRMFERYPDSPNPIREPAIVLVDEIDLHLHPEWQRKIIAHLTKYFPNTQFIVTAHSPLVVQSAEKINLVLLEKEGDHVNIRQPKIPTYQGWSLEEILTDVMGLDDRTHSDVYLDLYDRFEKAVEAEDYEAAQAAYEGLAKIVHPSSHLPKLLRLRMSSLMPA